MAHQPSAAALRWLSHPVTLAALALLILNDRVLKGAWGNGFTGKLSDVAWLVVAPPLLATVLALVAALTAALVAAARDPGTAAPPTRGGRRSAADDAALARLALTVVTIGFVVTKTTSGGAVLASTVLTALAGPSRVLADPTDLLALPALGLAWWTWRRVATRPAPARRRLPLTARPLLPLLVLPVAVVATAATSQSPSLHLTPNVIFSSGDAVLVGATDGARLEPALWYVTTDGETWERTEHWPGTTVPVAEHLARENLPRRGCVPDLPHVCFRGVGGGALGVERSNDGGVTWEPDWYLSPEVQRALADRYRPDHEPLTTYGVAIVTTDAGFRVYAVNGGDGVAVCREDGVWERRALGSEPLVPLPGEPTAWNRPVPAGVVLGVAAAMVPLGASGRRRGAPERHLWGWLAGAAVPLTASAVLTARWSVAEGQRLTAEALFEPLVVLLLPGALLLPAVALVIAGGVRARGTGTTWVALVCGAGVGVTVETVGPAPLAVLGASAVLAAGVLAARHLQGRPPPPDPYGWADPSSRTPAG